MMKAMPSAIHSSASCQPTAVISPCPTGSTANWPKLPPAEAMPSARLRFSGAAMRPITPSTTLKVVPDRPIPISRPAPRLSPSALSA